MIARTVSAGYDLSSAFALNGTSIPEFFDRDWPNRAASHFVHAGGIRWHFQEMGNGPRLLLLHGAGSSTHSWRGLGPQLAENFTVISPDLPGHGFTERPISSDLSLEGVARLVSEFLHAVAFDPVFVVGHSAGAAIIARLCVDRRINPECFVGLNAALLPLSGVSGRILRSLAHVTSVIRSAPSGAVRRAYKAANAARWLRGTGSHIDDVGVGFYERLLNMPTHIGSTLTMLAQWDLARLESELPLMTVPLVLIAGRNDQAIPPWEARIIARMVPGARVFLVPGLGHLAHEEAPEIISQLILKAILK